MIPFDMVSYYCAIAGLTLSLRQSYYIYSTVIEIFDLTWKPGLGSLKVIGSDTDRSATYGFLLTFHSNQGPISYRFRDNRVAISGGQKL